MQLLKKAYECILFELRIFKPFVQFLHPNVKVLSVKLFDRMEREKAFDNENGESFYMKRLDYVLLISVSGSLDVYTNYILFSLACKDSSHVSFVFFLYMNLVYILNARNFYVRHGILPTLCEKKMEVDSNRCCPLGYQFTE